MEIIEHKKQSIKSVKEECKFCKCRNYLRQRCIKEDDSFKLVKQNVVIPREGDKDSCAIDNPI